MIEIPIAIIFLLLAAIPAIVFRRNLSAYRPPEPLRDADESLPSVSILIPARNEAHVIEETVRAALLSRRVDLEVIVLDDQSDDETAAIVGSLAARDSRLRLEKSPPLPAGWCGKQHACAVLAELARHEFLLFIDADVRLATDGAARAVHFLQQSGAGLVSGVPFQQTGTLLERLLIPLIHFVLLGYLPMRRMRMSTHPSYGAGCGQLFVTGRTDYRRAGGHAAIRRSLHDGVTLPRAYRTAGMLTDLFDATDLARCRMYRSGAEVWRGLKKNAMEGLAAPSMIVPATLLLVGGQMLPFVLMAGGLLGTVSPAAAIIGGLAAVFAIAPRVWGAARFRQPWISAVLHPLAIGMFLTIQWAGLAEWLIGRPARWKNRSYAFPLPEPAAAMTEHHSLS